MSYIFLLTVLCILSILTCFSSDANGNRAFPIIWGLIGAIIAGILILGAAIRNATTLIVWIVLAVVQCIITIGTFIWTIVKVVEHDDDVSDSDLAIGLVVVLFIAQIGGLLFKIWSIYCAKRAIDEIREG